VSKVITLSNVEMMVIAAAGAGRQVAALARNRPEPYGPIKTEPFGNHIAGCAGEYVVARELGLFWHFYHDKVRRSSDIEGGPQVRSTPYPNGSLILHDEDPDDERFVLVTGTMPTLTIVGSLIARYGKVEQHWRDNERTNGREAYFVPQSALVPWGDEWVAAHEPEHPDDFRPSDGGF
jgi:hypothetical protein